MPLVDRPYVEAMAVMAQYSPFFEKAGMKRIMVRQSPEPVSRAVSELEGHGFKPYLLASTQSNHKLLTKMSQEDVERVKGIICKVGYFKRLQACKRPFVTKKEFEGWLKKQDTWIIAKVLSRLAVLNEVKVYLIWKNPSI